MIDGDVGMAHVKDIPALDEIFESRQVKDLLPRNLGLKWGVKAIDEQEQWFQLYAIKVTNRDGSCFRGDVVTDAVADFEHKTSPYRAGG